MCGIVGYLGINQAYPILIKGLKLLEYRGYDSAGVTVLTDTQFKQYKKEGKVVELEQLCYDKDYTGNLGIAHTRWATHGEPNEMNAHPHTSNSGNLSIVHNGIIENCDLLKDLLLKQGYVFQTDTDTEVLVNWIEYIASSNSLDIEEALILALKKVQGAYALALLSKDNMDTMILARKSSPLVVGVIDKKNYVIASDVSPIIEHTDKVIYLKDNEICILNKKRGLRIHNIMDTKERKKPVIEKIDTTLENIDKGSYDTFMEKEIYEQPHSILNTLRGRLNVSEGVIMLGGIKEVEQKLMHANRIIIVACGTSWIAGLVGKYIMEKYMRVPVDIEFSSEFKYKNPIIHKDCVAFAISQSGETADTISAIELLKSKGCTVLGICNVVGSTISRITEYGCYTHAGPEIGVASTKAFTSQVTILKLITLLLSKMKGEITTGTYYRLINEFSNMPNHIKTVLESATEVIKRISKQCYTYKNALYLGRGVMYPVAMEGALKLKEISYIHSEAYPAGEIKHGPLALVDENMLIIVLLLEQDNYDKMVSNIKEIKSRKGKVFIVTDTDKDAIKDMADYWVTIPKVDTFFASLLAIIPLQLFSYHVSMLLGRNIDQPRNLAKSVTVE